MKFTNLYNKFHYTERDLSQQDGPPDAIPAARTDHIALILNATTAAIEQQQPKSMPVNNKGMRITPQQQQHVLLLYVYVSN